MFRKMTENLLVKAVNAKTAIDQKRLERRALEAAEEQERQRLIAAGLPIVLAKDEAARLEAEAEKAAKDAEKAAKDTAAVQKTLTELMVVLTDKVTDLAAKVEPKVDQPTS